MQKQKNKNKMRKLGLNTSTFKRVESTINSEQLEKLISLEPQFFEGFKKLSADIQCWSGLGSDFYDVISSLVYAVNDFCFFSKSEVKRDEFLLKLDKEIILLELKLEWIVEASKGNVKERFWYVLEKKE